MDLLRNSLRIQAVEKGQRIANYGEMMNKILIVFRGQAMIRIPFDNLSKRMILKHYYEYVHSLAPGSEDPMEKGKGKQNQNVIKDYN